jgi:hypothetical protein
MRQPPQCKAAKPTQAAIAMLVLWVCCALIARSVIYRSRAVAAGIMVLPAILTIYLPRSLRMQVAEDRQRAGQCPACGYDLRESRHHCPECGKPVQPNADVVFPVQFAATEFLATSDADLVTVELCCKLQARRLLLLRSLPAEEDDWGPYIEYNDQDAAGYDRIAGWALDRDRLQVTLTEPIGHGPKYSGFDVTLAYDAPKWPVLEAALVQIFSSSERLSSTTPT